MFDISVDARTALGIARFYSPIDTGNAKFNATNKFMTSKGFKINYSLADAYYIYFLEEGTKKTTQHLGYISNRTVPAIANFIKIKYVFRDRNRKKKYQGMALNGNLDRTTGVGLEQRKSRHEQSLNYDLEKQSLANQWEHNKDIENKTDDWERVDYID
jgi:hypothetical protein